MKKIDNWSDIQEFTRFKNPVGGFICEIKEVEDVPDKEYLKIYYDIAEAVTPDQQEFVGMYTKRKKEKDFDYPSTIVSYKDSSLGFFKGFVTALEKSNKGYEWDNDETKFVGKLIGFVIGEEEYEGQDKNGATKIKVRTRVTERHSVDAIREGDFTTPEFKKLEQKSVKSQPNPFANNGSQSAFEPKEEEPTFAALSEEEDDCPF